ncbi:hypothetical protein C0992_000614, partial [Termitomyces sp. T32_za158]
GFLVKLQDYCLACMCNEDYDGDVLMYTPAQRRHIHIVGNKIYRHKQIQVNYTTYDCQRAQDTLNPQTHANALVISQEDQEDGVKPFPYWFCHILGIFHASVLHTGPKSTSRDPQRIEFLWVRWYGREVSLKSGWGSRRLHKIGFVDGDDDAAFGFLNPAQVIRGVRLIPSFCNGKTSEPLPPSISAHASSEKDKDYRFYDVGI